MDHKEVLTLGSARPNHNDILEGKYVKLRPVQPEEDVNELYEASHNDNASKNSTFVDILRK
jgi:hypothetical protein